MLLAVSFALALGPVVRVCAAESVVIDASSPSQVPGATSYRGGSLTSVSGHTIGINSMYLTMDGRPWLPVMGEFHYSRVPESEWEEELLKMKSAGVQIVSTYVIWIHHEEVRGEFDWSGQRDLRRFAELCKRHGLYLVVRIGPWAHGEVRNGGLPDWVLKDGPTRRNDTAFMANVETFYAQIGAQLRGLLWKDGGPVIGVQLENEYSARGPLEGEEYILALKNLAIRDGLDVPLYTVTGWDNAVVPRDEVLPVFGGYPDAPWDSSTAALPPNEVYMFRFRSRVAGNMGAVGGARKSNAVDWDTPFLTAELGGGVQDTYHRRPVIEADDVAAMVPVMLGSGANLYGYYMFQGGENPDGRLSTLQESQATGYPTDVPTKSYDFQAPLSEFGEERASLRKLKVFHYFLNDFGSDLARMSVHVPSTSPKSADDLSVIRASVRSEGKRGFLFVNNYVRGTSMPLRKSVQFEVPLPGSTLRIPETPVDIPSGSYFIWPFNLEIGGARLKYATAQLFARMEAGGEETFFFEQISGIPTEFVIKSEPELVVTADGAVVRRRGEEVSISNVPAGWDHEIRIRRGGKEVRLILLSSREAENAWKISIDGSTHLLETDQDFFANGSTAVLESEGDAKCTFSIYPAVNRELKVAGGDLRSDRKGELSQYAASVPDVHPTVATKRIKDAGRVPAVKLGPALSWRPKGVAMAPEDHAFKMAAEWEILVSHEIQTSTVSDLYLRVNYRGDVARLSVNGNLLEDSFDNGLVWTVGLKRFLPKIGDAPLRLSILPLRRDAPIFFEKSFWDEKGLPPNLRDTYQVVELRGVTVVPKYRFELNVDGH